MANSNLTDQQLIELGMANLDPVYFFEQFLKIKLTAVQADLAKFLANKTGKIAVNLERRSGTSTVIMGMAFWQAIFTSNQRIGIGQIRLDPTMLREMFNTLPLYMRKFAKTITTNFIEFDQGSRIDLFSTGANLRGLTFNRLYFDPFTSLSEKAQEEAYHNGLSCTSAKPYSLVLTGAKSSGSKIFDDALANPNFDKFEAPEIFSRLGKLRNG